MLPLWARGVIDESFCLMYDETSSAGRQNSENDTIHFTFAFIFMQAAVSQTLDLSAWRWVLRLSKRCMYEAFIERCTVGIEANFVDKRPWY